MPGLDAAGILSVWERGSGQPLGERAVTLLELAALGASDASALPVGTRDALLLRIRRRLFGDRIEGVTACNTCGEELDLTLSVAQLLSQMPPADPSVGVPTAGDLAAIASAGSVEAGVAFLTERLGLQGEDALAVADPGAEIQLVSACPSCGARDEAFFDPPSFLAKELQALAHDMLWDVHALARAYGWDEPTILALTPSRRRFYLDATQR
ncbi:MAG TPA: hypothetical protein VGI19_13475 [Candidatus Cybelea sp.]